jgi:uncharacterized Zn finger protein
MSPRSKKPAVPERTVRNHTSPAAVGDLQSLVDQVQALRRRHKKQPTAASAAELNRLRGLLLDALELDDDEPPPASRADEDNSVYSDDDDTFLLDDTDEEIWEEDESGEWRSRRDWSRFTPSKRIPVDNGLALRSRRGPIGETWWSRRFLRAVESLLMGGRLSRGATYARQGQVIDLGIGSGLTLARVQGSRRQPYAVQISMPAVSEARWDAIIEILAGQAGYAARLLAGELPHEIEDVFAEVGVALFPERDSRLVTECNCPDWANPCKHAAAVCYLMAEAFDQDPFLLLAFRGRDREGLLADLQARRGVVTQQPDAVASTEGGETAAPIVPLSTLTSTFWQSGAALREVHCLPKAAEVPAAVLQQLPRGVLTVRGRDIADLLKAAYGRLTTDAEARAFGGSSGKPSSRK